MSQKKKPLKALTDANPTAEEYQIAWQEFQRDGPRGATILATTLIERALKELLLQHLDPAVATGGDADMFGVFKPLSSFSAKINLGYGMRLYGLRTHHDLILLKDIRNLFAHGPLSLNFNHPDIKAAIHEFQCHERYELPPRAKFQSAVFIIFEHLRRKRESLSHSVRGLD